MRILVLPGDCIGPEITAATVACVEAANRRFGLRIEIERREIGLASLKTHGTSLPDEVFAACRAADGIILGPVHNYSYPPKEQGGLNPSKELRIRLDLFANMRPAKTFKGVPCVGRPMDLVIARENTQGFYADRNMHMGMGEFMPSPDVALSIRNFTAEGCRRISRVAFEAAMRRNRHVTIVTKANVLKLTEGLFKRVAGEVAKEFPEVAFDEVIVDAMAALLVRVPSRFDVVLTSNMFGDILSDEAAELTGGLGLGGSLNCGDEFGVAQAAHGSAPDIAGQDKANPTALILSAAMLLDWLGGRKKRDDLAAAAAAIRAAVEATLADPRNHTVDLGGKRGTRAFGEAVAGAILARAA
ncbi:MAG: isocitrate/isopropylmalate dehydrogenase family protein [Proteobacteria bacterium]|nr:isocitrate/isopropylmalate dehydrogenase family protein [Pseudomonadota bacterium]